MSDPHLAHLFTVTGRWESLSPPATSEEVNESPSKHWGFILLIIQGHETESYFRGHGVLTALDSSRGSSLSGL
jgi:hypothetical protein